MNIEKLKAAEAQFLQLYPLGFKDPEMLKIGKKHKKPQMVEQCQQLFKVSSFNKQHVDPTLTTSNAAFSGFLMMSML